jgi:hypothetical protein
MSDDLTFPSDWKMPAPRLDFVEPEPDFVIHRAMKKPVEIETVKASTDNLGRIVEWIKSLGHHAVLGDGQLIIQTLEGPFTVRPGDQVMRGVRGEFYRCDAEIYDESYDDLGPVDS